MENTFSGIIDVIHNLPLEDKQELLAILEKNVADERRNEMYNNYLKAKEEAKQGKLFFTSDINQLKQML